MSKTIKTFLVIAAIAVLPLISLAQTPPHPNNGAAPGVGNTPVGGGAPIDGGLSILLALGLGYGAKKMYVLRKK